MAIIHPFTHAEAATLHDTNNNFCIAFLVGTAGDGTLKVTTTGGETITLHGLLAGYIYPISCSVLWTTGSGVSNVIKLW